MELKEKIKIGIRDAVSSKGANKGMLKRKCPPINTFGAAAWQAIMAYSNPHKMGFAHMMFMDDDKRELYDYIIEVGRYIDLSGFDSDSKVLRRILKWSI